MFVVTGNTLLDALIAVLLILAVLYLISLVVRKF